MKNTIIGAILAAFLVLSVSFIAPINVQAVESSVKSNISELVNLIAEDSSLVDLVDDSPEVDALLDAIKNADEQTIENPADNPEFMAKVNAVLELDEFNSLVGIANPYIKEGEDKYVLDSIGSLADHDFKDTGKYYKVSFDENDEFKITAQKTDEITEDDAVLVSSDGEIITKNYGNLLDDGDDLTLLELIFIILIALAGVVVLPLLLVLILVLIFEVFAAIIGAILGFLTPILTPLVFIIIGLVGIAFVIGFVSFLIQLIQKLLALLDGSKESEETSKANICNRKTLGKIKANFKNLLSRIITFFNVNLKTVFA